MLVWGLTGGIACGKSTVARLFAARGAEIIDADQVARDVVEPDKPAYHDIVRAFGEAVLTPERTIDRQALGKIVFSDPAARSRLNAITHPRIAAETAARLAALRKQNAKIVLYEAALLVETGAHKMYNGLIVVTADPEVQLRRLIARDKISEEEARQKIASQFPLEQKVAVADYVVDNSGDLARTERAVDEVWAALQKEFQEERS